MKDKALTDICQYVLRGELGVALAMTENVLLMQQPDSIEALNAIKSDFQLMADYWLRGYDDPVRHELYRKLLRRLYVLLADVDRRRWIEGSPYLKSLRSQLRYDWSAAVIRHELEEFVSESALLELQPEHVRKSQTEQLMKSHYQYMGWLFDSIFTSLSWKENMASAFIDILLSPTVDLLDKLQIVSATTLSVMQTFDYQKWRSLATVYQQTADEPLRQRALVGWVLSIDSTVASLYEELPATVRALCDDERCRNELTELQLQLFYCLDAEEDTKKIQKDIIPDLMNGNNLKMTPRGLVEMDEDTLEEILHPEAAERNMERMEESMRRMADMQKKGSDIYFGGFSQMKRFPFFNELANWFLPYDPHHPAVSSILEKTRGKKFLQIITQIGAFCDSDMYSFVLAFEQVLSRFPANMLKLIDDGEATPIPVGGEISFEEKSTPAFMRRMYLQNLYRFYRLFHSRSLFRNPFAANDTKDYLIFANPLFNHTALQGQYMQVAGFLMKRKLREEAMTVLANGDEVAHDFSYFMTMGALAQHGLMGSDDAALDYYRQAVGMRPDNEKAQLCYARSLYRQNEMEAALTVFQQLLDIHPDHKNYQLNAAVCLMRLERYDEALKLLFKLVYEHPEDPTVSRVIAWTLTLNGQYDQAVRYYEKLLATEEATEPEDLLNYGICLWLNGNVEGAVGLFRRYAASDDEGKQHLRRELTGESHAVLKARDINDTDIQLMLDIVAL